MTLFKICGLRDADAAAVAIEAGADFLGFVFVEGVRRQLSPERGANVIAELRESPSWISRADADRPKIVGLFANQTAEFVNRIARDCGLDYAQLCGDETPAFWDALELPVIRQVKVREELGREGAVDLAARQAAEALNAGNLAVLDKHKRGFLGGTGAAFDWTLASEIGERTGLLLAGDLAPRNVSAAIVAAAPWSVDMSTDAHEGLSLAGKVTPENVPGSFSATTWYAGVSSIPHGRLLLAGGLAPENVSAAIAAAAPWGVDVSTGVETDGAKDRAKIRRFAQAVQDSGR